MKSKKETGPTWTDDYGFTLTWDEMIDEIKLLRLVNRKFHDLLFKYKVPVQAIANAENQTKKELYPVNKPIEIYTEEVEIKKPVVKRKRASKKVTRKKK